MSYFINFTLGEFSIHPQVLLLEAGMALLVPMLAGLYPILSGTRLTIPRQLAATDWAKPILAKTGWIGCSNACKACPARCSSRCAIPCAVRDVWR